MFAPLKRSGSYKYSCFMKTTLNFCPRRVVMGSYHSYCKQRLFSSTALTATEMQWVFCAVKYEYLSIT
jgi:hypothetical protein